MQKAARPLLVVLTVDGRGARYSGVMYRSPVDPLAADDVMAAVANKDLKGHLTMASKDGGDEEGLGVGGAAVSLLGLLSADFKVSLVVSSLSLVVLSSKIVIGAAHSRRYSALICYHFPKKNHSKFPVLFYTRHTGFSLKKQIYVAITVRFKLWEATG